MSKGIKATHMSLLFIALQYIAAILVMVFVTVELSVALDFLKNLLFYLLIFIMPILLFLKKVFKVSPVYYLNLNCSFKCIAIGFVIAAPMALIFFITNRFQINTVDKWWLLVLTGTVLAGLFEEIVFRGFYLKFFKEKYGFLWANITASVLFSLLHINELLEQNIIQLVLLFILGIFLGYLCEKTKSVWVPVIIHITFNILIFLFR